MSEGLDIKGQLRGFFRLLGAERPEIGLLHDADPFLDAAGEDFRQRIFLTNTGTGELKCLRPEFTIPVCQTHVENGAAPATYAYIGEVFRQRINGEGAIEFDQAGIEDIGNENRQIADALCLERAINALNLCDVEDFTILTGDQALFEATLAAVEVPMAWRKKLLRSFGNTERLVAQIDSLAGGEISEFDDTSEELKTAIADNDKEKLVSLISANMQDAGLPANSGRTASAIADRVLEKVLLSTSKLSAKQSEALKAYLTIDVPAIEAVEALTAFQLRYGLNLGDALLNLENRIGSILGISSTPLRFKASFGRALDYYTGFVFEIYAKKSEKPLVGGGRYDRLLTLLGSNTPIPAVGFAVWVDRIAEAQAQTGAQL